MPIYHCQEAQHNKFWSYEITSGGKTLSVSWGRIGGSSDSQTKSFYSATALQQFLNKKISEKTGKGYKLVNEATHSNESKTAKSLGIENKIQRILWVGQKGNKLSFLTNYDPAQFVYVEILNSWSKEVHRLLLSKTETWEIDDSISESNRSITYDNKVRTTHSPFADTVRAMLKGIAVKVAETVKTIKFAAIGARNLFDDDAKSPAAAEEEGLDVSEIKISGCDQQVVSKFASLGNRVLEL